MLWAALAVVGPRTSRRWGVYALLGLMEPALSYLLYDLGLARTSAIHAALLESLEAPFVVILGVVLLREKVRAALVVALGLGLAGAALVSLPSGDGGPDRATALGDLLVVLAIAVAAFYSIAVNRFGADDPSLTVTSFQFLAASCALAPVVAGSWVLHASRLPGAGHGYLVAAVASGVLGTAGAYLLFNVGITRTSASAAGLTLNLIPVFGTVAAVVGLGEHLQTLEIVGGALILASLLGLHFASRTADRRRPL